MCFQRSRNAIAYPIFLRPKTAEMPEALFSELTWDSFPKNKMEKQQTEQRSAHCHYSIHLELIQISVAEWF